MKHNTEKSMSTNINKIPQGRQRSSGYGVTIDPQSINLTGKLWNADK